MTQPTQTPFPLATDSAAPSAATHAPNTDGIWYASYPADVPHDIDVNQYESVVQFFDECIAQFRERVAYVSVGANLTYGELGRKASAFAAVRIATPSGVMPHQVSRCRIRSDRSSRKTWWGCRGVSHSRCRTTAGGCARTSSGRNQIPCPSP